MLKLTILRNHKSLSQKTNLCDLGSLSIISGKNGTGKSQLLCAIRNGDIELHTVIDGSSRPVQKDEIIYESIWSVKNKIVNPPSQEGIAVSLRQHYESYGKQWDFTFGYGNRTYKGSDILKEMYGENIPPNPIFDESKVNDWAFKNALKIQPFQIESLAEMLLDYKLMIMDEDSESNRKTLRENSVWNRLNHLLANKAELNFMVLEPEKSDVRNPYQYIPKCKNSNDDIFSITELSDGEKVILTIAMSMLSAESKNLIAPKVILLDEVDATLHPSMILNLLKLLKDAFVDEFGTYIIFATHSPTTIALFPNDDLYYMQHDNDYRLLKSTKDSILKELAYGIPTLSVTYRNRRNVVVESEYDALWLDKLYRILQNNGRFLSEISLNFIPSGKNGKPESGNCDNVKSIVKSFNDTEAVVGVIDQDRRGGGAPEGIYILTDGERYSLENLLFDPLWVISLFRNNPILNIYQNSKYGFSDCCEDIQREVNIFIDKVKCQMSDETDDLTVVPVSYTDGTKIEMPQWYLNRDGHSLAIGILEAFSEIKKNCRDEKGLINAILGNIEQNFFCSPTSLIDTFNVLTRSDSSE